MRTLISKFVVPAAIAISATTPAFAQQAPKPIEGGVQSDVLAGHHGGLFFLRDRADNFRLYIQLRGQVDSYNYLGSGVPDTTLKSTIFIRRARAELSGEVLRDFSFMVAGDWGANGNDNADGKSTETRAADPGAAPSATSGRYASAQSVAIRAQPTDVWIGYGPHPLFLAQIGAFDAPFTLENRTSDKFLPFMERALAARVVGVPENKATGLMFSGRDETKSFYYSAGIFNGDGQNRTNVDNRVDFMGRVVVHPLRGMADGVLRDAQVGMSLRYGKRDPHYVNYDYPSMSTQGAYTFWSPIYTGSKGRTHIIPAGTQLGVGGELRIPVSIVDLTTELVYLGNNTREAVEGFQSTNTERLGSLKGISYYAQLGVWVTGKRDVNGHPGYQFPTHVDLSKPDPIEPPRAVQLVARWEQVALEYDSASRGGVADSKNVDGKIKVNALSLGANYWATRHIRFTANYVYNMFPSSEPVAPSTPGGPQQSASQRALAPGNTLAKGIGGDARDVAHSHHELLFRAAVAF